jgi:hypothetical protein
VDAKTISTREIVQKGNRNNRLCIHLRIRLHWPCGVRPSWIDHLYVHGTKEAPPSSAPVSTIRSLLRTLS